MWYVYILRCKDKTLYVGITTNVTERVKCHNKGKASRYTRMRLPVELIYQEPHPSKSSARKREIQLKNWSRAKKEALANTKPQIISQHYLDISKSHFSKWSVVNGFSGYD
jgi:putative endonuclease